MLNRNVLLREEHSIVRKLTPISANITALTRSIFLAHYNRYQKIPAKNMAVFFEK